MKDLKALRLSHRVRKIERKVEEMEETVEALAISLDGLEEYVKRR